MTQFLAYSVDCARGLRGGRTRRGGETACYKGSICPYSFRTGRESIRGLMFLGMSDLLAPPCLRNSFDARRGMILELVLSFVAQLIHKNYCHQKNICSLLQTLARLCSNVLKYEIRTTIRTITLLTSKSYPFSNKTSTCVRENLLLHT